MDKPGDQPEQSEHQDADKVEDLELDEGQQEDVKGGGKVNVQDLSFTKKTDKSSP